MFWVMNKPKVTVCQGGEGFRLRVHLDAGDGGIVRFETADEFTKREADYRAVVLSSKYGFDRDELPTHNLIEAYPSKGDESK